MSIDVDLDVLEGSGVEEIIAKELCLEETNSTQKVLIIIGGSYRRWDHLI
jgi:hypothetical protein